MGRAVLISIRPEWTQKIVTGEKTVEIRKTRPNLETPFKCYIYETQGKSDTPWIDEDGHMIFRGCGKVVAEFTCTGIDEIKPANEPYGTYDIDDDYVLRTCLGNGAMWDYGKGQTLYGWNISDVRIFCSRPVDLSAFTGVRSSGGWVERYEIKRAPQSWCYVEVLG